MSDLVQNALVVLIVLGAVAFLVLKRVRARKKPTPFCGDCPHCASDAGGAATPPEPTLVSIGEPKRHEPGGGRRR